MIATSYPPALVEEPSASETPLVSAPEDSVVAAAALVSPLGDVDPEASLVEDAAEASLIKDAAEASLACTEVALGAAARGWIGCDSALAARAM